MAKVKTPLMCAEASGSLGGLEFKRNQYGNTVGRCSHAAARQTELQLQTRSHLRQAESAWRALSPVLKTAWEAFATHPSTGRNAYMGACLRNYAIGVGPPEYDPRYEYEKITPTGFGLKMFPEWDNYYGLNWTCSIDGSEFVIVYLQPMRANFTPPTRKFKYFRSDISTSQIMLLQQSYPSKYMGIKIVIYQPFTGVKFSSFAAVVEWGEEYKFGV